MNITQECCLSFHKTSLMVAHEEHINSYQTGSLRNQSSKSLGQRWSSMSYAPIFLHVFQTELFMSVIGAILQSHKVWGSRKEVHLVRYLCLKRQACRSATTRRVTNSGWKPRCCGSWPGTHSASSWLDSSGTSGRPWDNYRGLSPCKLFCPM